ncbi:MAG: RdgB/HAM1 family non-canonical purine NTP pyrophosphatase [Opitutaceae bacterium]|nr:RdgB/HAM1 family non-canonical purine NTP pyrophosphatase [Opitutaceae bacterium]
MKLHLASGNPGKAREMSALAAGSGGVVEIIPAMLVGGLPRVNEDAGTFVGNARKKALALKARLPGAAWVLADDSGLCVDELGGAPGVESAYYAGPSGDFAANLRKLIERMRGVPAGRRQAHFVCVLVLAGPGGKELVFEERVAGTLRDEPRGEAGFGYDPLFVPEGHHQTYAELSAAEKDRISHRGRAWAQLVTWVRAQTPGPA